MIRKAENTKLSDAQRLALALIEQHLAGRGWTFAFDNAKTRCGVCRYTKKVIGLSRHYVERNSIESVRNTILHEIAHAIAGQKAGHGRYWQAVARSIGCTGDRCARGVDMPQGKYTATCRACGKVHGMHRKPKRTYICACKGETEKRKLMFK